MGQGTSKYRKITRTPQTGENAGKKLWYATVVSDREMSFEDFVTHISEHNSPYSRSTIHGVLGVHLIGRNTKTWSNAELKKLTKIVAYDDYTSGVDGGGTENTPSGGDTSQGAGGDTNKDNGGTSQGGGGTSQGTGGGTDGGDDNVSL